MAEEKEQKYTGILIDQDDLIARICDFYSLCVTLIEAKNLDYAAPHDALRNIMMPETLGLCKAEVALLAIISNKLARCIKHCTDPDHVAVKEEALVDDVADLCNYAAFLHIVTQLRSEHEAQESPAV